MTTPQSELSFFMHLFRALGNEERLRMIVLLIQEKELCAQDVEKHFFLEQSTTSHHLNILKKMGIATSRKAGRHIYYSIDQDALHQILSRFPAFIQKGLPS